MITTQRVPARLRLPGAPKPPAGPSRRRWPWLILVLLAGYFVFAHGCHDDEDTELLAAPLREARP